MRKLHLFLIAVTSLGLVGGLGSRALLQPLPPSPLLERPEPNNKPVLPSEALRLPDPDTLLDLAANLAIEKYQNTSCEELSKMQPRSEKSSQTGGKAQEVLQEKAIKLLRQNPEIREKFINRVAPQIANKMFDCQVIP
jgi:hypothetical protein